MSETEKVINDLNVAKRTLCNPQMLTPEMCVRIGQSVTNAIDLLTEQEQLKHGRWVPMYELTSEGILPDEPMGYMCSQCNAKRKKRLNYCSNCGARMNVGGQEWN